MSDDSYSIKEMIEEFRRDTKESLNRIEAQTIRTNGRVTSLERSRVQIWTAISVASVLVGTIIFLSVSAINGKIKAGIAEALESKVDKVEYAK